MLNFSSSKLKPTFVCLICLVNVGNSSVLIPASFAQSARVDEDIPEEVLQTQVSVEANSNLMGTAQTPAAHVYEQQQLQVKVEDVPAQVAPSIQRTIVLLRLRKVLKSLLPFL